MAKEGDAFIEFHADTDQVYPEAARGVKGAAERLEHEDLKKVGHDMGETVSRSMGDEFEKQGPELGRSIERGLTRTKVRTKVKVTYDKDNNVLRRTVEHIVDDVEKAFEDASGPGGPFNRIGSGIADAVGAGFNISGKSPLIALLIPVVGAIAGLVIAAVEAGNALLAVLAAAPALIGTIALQVGVLFFAFKGLGNAIGGAFAATNAKELKAAIKDLTPAAQDFVRQLLPLKDLFHALNVDAQQGFFKALGVVIPQIQSSLGHILGFGFQDLAKALGEVARQFALLFASPEFATFLSLLFKAAISFVHEFGPVLVKFIDSIVRLSIAVMPFLSGLADLVSFIVTQWADALDKLSKDPGFQDWLGRMIKVLFFISDLLSSAGDFIAAFASSLDKAGGVQIIDELSKNLALLAYFLASPAGVKAMEGIITATVALLRVFVALVVVIIDLFLAFQLLLDGLEALGGAVVWFVTNAGPAIGQFFSSIGDGVVAFLKLMQIFWEEIQKLFGRGRTIIETSISDAVETIRGLPGRAGAALANIGTFLYDKGRALIQGFINGIKSMVGSLVDTVRDAVTAAVKFFPGSPAEEGPLSGQGYSMFRGQRMIQDFAKGIQMEAPALRNVSSEAVSNIVFGPGSVQVTFAGVVPTPEQARRTGMSVGTGINGQLAARDVQLAVRAM